MIKRYQNTSKWAHYVESIEELIKNRFVDLVPTMSSPEDFPEGSIYHMPFRMVVNEDRVTSKHRLVFNSIAVAK